MSERNNNSPSKGFTSAILRLALQIMGVAFRHRLNARKGIFGNPFAAADKMVLLDGEI